MAPSPRDYYDVLGIGRNAAADAIRKAFRARARRTHPDVSTEPDANERFRELAEAYSVLSRKPSRVLYDSVGSRGRGHGGVTPVTDEAAPPAEAEAEPSVGLAAEVFVTASEAARGTTAAARVAGPAACRDCDGSGEGPGEAQPCESCDGTGRLRRRSRAELGRLLQVESCYRCDGKGRVAAPCAACGGSGRVDMSGQILVTVPPGTRDGARIALAGGGDVLVRVLSPAGEDRAVRLASAIGFVLAVAFLAFVLFG